MSRAPAVRRPPAAKSAGAAASAPATGYFQEAQLPLPSLLLLLPFMIVYEVGVRFYGAEIIAFSLLEDFFTFFGATGRYLPPFAVVAILLAWHVARNDTWRVDVRLLAGMGVEGALLGLPVILISVLCTLSLQHLPLYAGAGDWRGLVVLSFGAGIYEELVFRLIAFALFSFVLLDLLKLPKFSSGVLIVVGSAILFALYHYLGSEVFGWRSLIFRTAAGVYFGLLFVYRGFGITAFSHAAYDVYVVVITTASLRGG